MCTCAHAELHSCIGDVSWLSHTHKLVHAHAGTSGESLADWAVVGGVRRNIAMLCGLINLLSGITESQHPALIYLHDPSGQLFQQEVLRKDLRLGDGKLWKEPLMQDACDAKLRFEGMKSFAAEYRADVQVCVLQLSCFRCNGPEDCDAI